MRDHKDATDILGAYIQGGERRKLLDFANGRTCPDIADEALTKALVSFFNDIVDEKIEHFQGLQVQECIAGAVFAQGRAWLIRKLIWMIAEVGRKRQSEGLSIQDVHATLPRTKHTMSLSGRDSEQDSPESVLFSTERKQLVQQALDLLDRDERYVVHLIVDAGATLAEIGRLIGRPISGVQSIRRSAYTKMRLFLHPHLDTLLETT